MPAISTQAMLVEPGRCGGRRRWRCAARIALREPVLRLAGPIRAKKTLAAMAAGDYRFEVEAIDPLAHAGSAGRARSRDARHGAPAGHARLPGAAPGSAILRNGRVRGVRVRVAGRTDRPDGRASAVYLVQIFAYALVTLARRHGATWCSALVPGE